MLPVGASRPRASAEGQGWLTGPLEAEATQHSLWAHRLETHLSTSFLSWLKHQLPLEAPQPGPAHQDSSPVCFCSSLWSPQIVLYMLYAFPPMADQCYKDGDLLSVPTVSPAPASANCISVLKRPVGGSP